MILILRMVKNEIIIPNYSEIAKEILKIRNYATRRDERESYTSVHLETNNLLFQSQDVIMLIQWTRLNKRLEELKEERAKISKKFESNNDKAVLLRPELEQLEKQLDEHVAKLKVPIENEMKKLGKQKIVEKTVAIGKIDVLEYWNKLNNGLERIEDEKGGLLEKNGLAKEWNSLEKRRAVKQRLFNKKINELRMPIMIEIGEWRIKKDGILTGKVNGSAVECDAKIQELNKKYNQNWKNVLGPINEEVYKLTAMQRNLLKEKNLLGKWDKLEDRKREIEDRKREIEDRKREIEDRIKQLREKERNVLQKNKIVKKLGRKINKIKNELDRINQRRKRLTEPLDVEIVKIKQRLKVLEKNHGVKRWVKLNKNKIPPISLGETEFNIPQVGIYSLGETVNLFEGWKKGAPKAPYYVNWRVTGACNSKCIMCNFWNSKNSKENFTPDQTNRILKELKRIGVVRISFNGGEPTLMKNLLDTVRKAKDMGFYTDIKTNGSNLTGRFITKAYETGLDEFFISLDSHDAKVHDSIRRRKFWKGVIDAIKFIKENTNIKVVLNSVIMTRNYKELDKMAELAKELGVDNITFSQVDDFHEKSNKNLRLNKKQMREFYFKVVPKILKKAGCVAVNFSPFFTSLTGKSNKVILKGLVKTSDFAKELKNFSEEKYGDVFYSYHKCYTPFLSVQINPDGSVYPCCTTLNMEQFNMGNIKKEPFAKIWNSKKFREFRSQATGDKPEICKKCRMDFDLNYRLSKILN